MRKYFLVLLTVALLVLPLAAFSRSPESPEGNFSEDQGFEGQADREEEMQRQGMQRMKQGIKKMEKAIQQLEKLMQKVQTAGYTVPEEITNAVVVARQNVQIIQTTEDFDEAQEALDAVQEVQENLGDYMQQLQMLSQFPKIVKQAERQLTKLNKMLEKIVAKLQTSEFDITSSVAAIQTKVAALRTALDGAKSLAQTGNMEDAFTKLEDDFFGGLEDAYESVGMLEALRNLSKAVKSVEKGITQGEKVLKRLESKGEDVSALKNIIENAGDKLAELKSILKSSEVDSEAAFALLQELDGLRISFENGLEETGGGDFDINFFGGKSPAMPKEFNRK